VPMLMAATVTPMRTKFWSAMLAVVTSTELGGNSTDRPSQLAFVLDRPALHYVLFALPTVTSRRLSARSRYGLSATG
jgi:hypothetical protein